jgi:hypothetical protein
MWYNTAMYENDFNTAANVKVANFSALAARDEDGARPNHCPSCRMTHASFPIISVAGACVIHLVSPRYLGDGIWLCGMCEKQFQWSSDPDEDRPPRGLDYGGLRELLDEILKRA